MVDTCPAEKGEQGSPTPVVGIVVCMPPWQLVTAPNDQHRGYPFNCNWVGPIGFFSHTINNQDNFLE